MNSLKIDTGIDWLGEVPREWTRCRLKTTIKESFNGVWGDEPKDNENDLICIRVADFNYNKLTINLNKYTVRNILENQHNRMLKKGDILIEKSGGGEKQPVGRAIIYDNEIGKAVCSNFIGKITLYKSKVIPKFVVYYLSNLYSKSYLNESIYLPLLTEQQRIADFLDQKCALIDALIEKKQKLIKLKKEERTALINQTVTKGLNLNVPMKDSGIEWLGEIPEHWKVKKIKYLSRIVLGKMLTPSDKGDYLLKPYLRAQNLHWFNVDISDVKDMWFSENELKQYILEVNDLLVSEGGEVGRTSIWKDELEECYIQNSVHKVTFSNTNNPEYFLYLFYIYGSQGHFNSIVSRVSIAHLTREKLKEVKLLVPPRGEQDMITNYLTEFDKKNEEIIKQLETQINLLKEYKTTLISEAVTGKLCL
jgi:type I restriction enzyme S subunit